MFFYDYDRYFSAGFCIYAERVKIRRIRKSDTDDLHEYFKRPESCAFSHWTEHKTRQETKEYIDLILSRYRKRSAHIFAIVQKSSGRVLGTVSFTEYTDDYRLVEIGYGINSDYWGKGYGSEAVSAFVGYAFDNLGTERVSARVLPENTSSMALLKKCGFRRDGILRKGIIFKGLAKDVEVYSVLREEYCKLS